MDHGCLKERTRGQLGRSLGAVVRPVCVHSRQCGAVECVVRSVVWYATRAVQTISTLWVLTSLVTMRSNRVIGWSCGRVIVWSCGRVVVLTQLGTTTLVRVLSTLGAGWVQCSCSRLVYVAPWHLYGVV